eukprot:5316544-Pyramimonas_sp.AAC.1
MAPRGPTGLARGPQEGPKSASRGHQEPSERHPRGPRWLEIASLFDYASISHAPPICSHGH